ncbi:MULTISPECIES: hypothetical protein [unclassified Cetobacterium]|uniref:hypothetical protein n=1 Tax=unclassified Cetobacterium TaxID=2630983 RepID=UPI00163C48A9|nr:hypothetical protein [Cetobacterium sp. 8H]MBC2850272.1 hypothetical protein [Cetobacterium sp. 8H]
MENKILNGEVKEKRNELILRIFDTLDFQRIEIPEEYSKDTFFDFLKWKIGTNIAFRYDKQLNFIYSQKNKDLQERLLKNLEFDFRQEQFEILSNIYFEFGKK